MIGVLGSGLGNFRRGSVRRAVMPALRALLTALLPGLLVACSAASTPSTNPAGVKITSEQTNGSFHGILLDDPYTKPAQTFVDTAGNPFRIDRDVKRPVVLLFFGYTHCPDVCSAVVADMASALRRLDPGVRNRVQVVYVTTDPERDTGPVIAEYLRRFDSTFIGVSGSLKDIGAAAESVGVEITGKQVVVGGYTIGHGAQIIGFGDGKSLVWVPGTAVSNLRADIVLLANPA